MSYNSLTFLILLLVCVGLYFCSVRSWQRQAILLAASIIFYLSAGGIKVMLSVLVSSAAVYILSRKIASIYEEYDQEKNKLAPKEQVKLFAEYKKKTLKYVWIGFFVLLGSLVYVKIGKLLKSNILVPLGISYYTFSSIGYLLDIYWKKAGAEKNYFRVLLCMIYFPHIVQGPISRYDDLRKQFEQIQPFCYSRLCSGMQRMMWGYFKKMVVADRIALYTSNIFAAPELYMGVEIAIAVFLGAFELYADFSGCMDIVLGASEVFGINLEENFRQPFFSESASEFWRRWHITLGAWFKNYVYMPAAMNPKFMKFCGQIRKRYGQRAGQIISMAVPTMLVWLLTGLWHGTGLDYVVWGLYWGIIIVLSAAFLPELKKLNTKLHITVESGIFKSYQKARTFLLFCIGRMLTVTGSLTGFLIMVKQLFKHHKLWVLFDGSIFQHGLDEKDFFVVILGILMIIAVDVLHEKKESVRNIIAAQPILIRWSIYYIGFIAVIILGIYGEGFNPSDFIYGGF